MSLNYFVFDGESSLGYGVYIGGQNTYNAPERDVTKVSIPGRNGDLIQDNGRFLNAQVPYTIVVMDEFRDKTDAIKAWLLSKTGYCKLVDTYHPGTYRLARVTGGIDFETSAFNATGKTQVIFDCKPERFLDSGDEVINVGVWGQTEVGTGDIVTFMAQENTRIKRTSVAITPSQSLNGYEYPWPGGGGKNILPTNRADIISRNTDGTWNGDKYTLNGVVFTFAYNADGALLSVYAKGTASAVTVVPLTSGIDLKTNVGYTITGCPAGGSSSTYELMLSQTTGTGGGFLLHTYAAGGTYTPTEDRTAGVRVLIRSGAEIDATYFPMVRLATVTDATFEPYSNICPISGQTDLTAYRTGVNLFGPNASPTVNAYIGPSGVLGYATGWTVSDYIAVPPDTELYFQPNSTAGDAAKTWFYDAKQNPIGYISSGPRSFTTPSNCAFMRFSYRSTSTDIMLNLGSTATAFKSYQGTAYPVSWQTEAGTVYCGSVDVVSGQLTVTHKSVTFDGSENWTWSELHGGQSHVGLSDMKPGSWYSDSNTKCDTFPKISGSAYGVMVGNNNNRVLFRYMMNLPGVTDGDTWKAWLSNNNVTVTYPIATPLVYNLTAVAISTILGQNNVWGDIGAVTVEWGENPNAILNPTRFVSKPKMRVIGSGSGIITIDAGAISVSNLDGYVDIDSDLMNCYKGSVNKNADVTLPNHTFPVMNPGVNHITFSGGITGIELNGKWWTI